MNIEFANRLQQLRKEKGYSQDQLAEAINVSRQSISKWERAESSPDSDNLIALAKLYNMSLDELIYSKPTEEQHDTSSNTNKDEFHINFKGINVSSKTGEKVHVGWDGIHVHDPNRNNHIDISANGINVNTPALKDKKLILIRDTINLIVVLVTLIAYLVVGTIFSIWHPTWIVFLLIPIAASLVEAIMTHDFKKFAYPVIVVAVYLIIGFQLDLWHPYWFLFLTIPIYYIIVTLISNLSNKTYIIDDESNIEK